MMKIKYLRDVTSPRASSGKTGQEKEVCDYVGMQLIAEGYAESASNKTKPGKEIKK